MPRIQDSNKTSLTSIIIPAIMGAAATIVAAFLSYSAGVRAIQIPLNATQTAEAKQPTMASTLIATQPPFIVTQIVEVIPTVDNKVLPIEAIPGTVYTYFYNSPDPKKSTALAVILGEPAGVAYRHTYNFPTNTKDAAGMDFRFASPMDLSDFVSMDFTIVLETELKSCDIYIRDDIGNFQGTSCKEPFSPKVKVTIEDSKVHVTIPLLDVFPEVNFKVVRSVYIVVSANPSQQRTEYEVKSIRFIK